MFKSGFLLCNVKEILIEWNFDENKQTMACNRKVLCKTFYVFHY
jgi:hypothetical protein